MRNLANYVGNMPFPDQQEFYSELAGRLTERANMCHLQGEHVQASWLEDMACIQHECSSSAEGLVQYLYTITSGGLEE